MRNTIKPKDGFHVKKGKLIDPGKVRCRIDDGEQPLFVAEKRSWDDYLDEKEGNECFHMCEVFTTVKGNQYIYWRDEEIDADYITRVTEGK